MENKGWIKLYRKTLDNGILRDPIAWTIFSWLMLKVDNKGKKIIGRYWASKELGINPNTFYKALQRLHLKYKIVTLVSNNKMTEVWIVNWSKYQFNQTFGNSSSNNRVTTGEHSNRIKNKEYDTKEEKILIHEDARRAIAEIKSKLKRKNLP